MVRDVRNFKDNKQILDDLNLFYNFGGCIVIEDEFSRRMVFEVVGKGKLSVLNHIVMAQKIISLEVVRSEYVVATVLEANQLAHLSVKLILEECH